MKYRYEITVTDTSDPAWRDRTTYKKMVAHDKIEVIYGPTCEDLVVIDTKISLQILLEIIGYAFAEGHIISKNTATPDADLHIEIYNDWRE